MPAAFLDAVDLEAIARRVGTPFYLYDAATLRRRIADVQQIAPGERVLLPGCCNQLGGFRAQRQPTESV